jgi:hypothetical protein
MIALVRFFLSLVGSVLKPKLRLAAENAALRHQLIVLRRKMRCACRKSNPNILVVQPAQDRAAKNGPGQFDGARDRRVLRRWILFWVVVCTENLSSGVVVVKSAKDGM